MTLINGVLLINQRNLLYCFGSCLLNISALINCRRTAGSGRSKGTFGGDIGRPSNRILLVDSYNIRRRRPAWELEECLLMLLLTVISALWQDYRYQKLLFHQKYVAHPICPSKDSCTADGHSRSSSGPRATKKKKKKKKTSSCRSGHLLLLAHAPYM